MDIAKDNSASCGCQSPIESKPALANLWAAGQDCCAFHNVSLDDEFYGLESLGSQHFGVVDNSRLLIRTGVCD
jgi:hypothetical protein